MPDQHSDDIVLARQQHEAEVIKEVWATQSTAAGVGQIITSVKIEGSFPHTILTVDWYWRSRSGHNRSKQFPLYHLEDGPDPNSDGYRPSTPKFSAGDKCWDGHDIINFIIP